MPPQQSQPNNPQLDPNQVSVGLAQTNHFLNQHLQSMMPPQEPAQDPNQGTPTDQQNTTDVKAEMQGLESRLMDELQTLKAEMKNQGDGKQEIADLKAQMLQIIESKD